MDSYSPTAHIRLMRGTHYPSDDRCDVVYRLQQLWVSPFVGEESEWRDVSLVDGDGDSLTRRTTPAELLGN